VGEGGGTAVAVIGRTAASHHGEDWQSDKALEDGLEKEDLENRRGEGESGGKGKSGWGWGRGEGLLREKRHVLTTSTSFHSSSSSARTCLTLWSYE
jgi:hypothetical protein